MREREREREKEKELFNLYLFSQGRGDRLLYSYRN
jgi:hypothetical protein